jgi:hypothetical protein
MTRIFKQLIILIILIGFVSCHKYPDDPFISLRTPFKRITKHQWILNNYTVNGVDSMSLFNDTLGRPIPNLVCFQFNNKYTVNKYTFHDEFGNGTWSIDKKNFSLCYARAWGLNYHLFNNGCTTWEIIELYEKTLMITTNTNGKTYKASFEGVAP